MTGALVIALFAAAAPRVAVVVHTTGFSDDDGKRVQNKIGAEVSSTGVELWALSKAVEVRTECLVDRGCARDLLRAADASWLVWIEATRAGGQVQLESHLLDNDGRTAAQDESAARVDEVTGNGALLSPVIAGALKQAATSATSATSATTTNAAGAANATTSAAVLAPTAAPLAADAKANDAKRDDVAKPEVSPLAIAGVATLGAGALLVIGGGALTAQQLTIINTASSAGVAKENAASTATAMMVVAGVGLGAAAAGAVLLYLGL